MNALAITLTALALTGCGVIAFLAAAVIAREVGLPLQEPRTWGDITPERNPE